MAKSFDRTQMIPETGRPITCPVCAAPLPDGDQAGHLIREHDYLQVFGSLLPRPIALTCLWDRVLNIGDKTANERLYQILTDAVAEEDGRSTYAVALEAELQRRLGTALLKSSDLSRLVRHLRSSEITRVHFWGLLSSSDPRMRELGRELLLPDLRANLLVANLTGRELRLLLERLCPREDVWEKIRICQRLGQFGVPAAALKDTLKQLHAERPVACPECGTPLPQDLLESHLRQVHEIYQFRGVQRSLQETADAMLTAVCGEDADYEAWDMLEALAREAYGENAESFLAGSVVQTLEGILPEVRVAAAAALAKVIAASESAAGITQRLVSVRGSTARYLSLLLAPRLPQPLSSDLVRAFLPMLARKRAPVTVQVAAVSALLRTTGGEGPAARGIIDAFTARRGKARSLERLRQLEEQIGPMPVISERCEMIESRIRMRCPRCKIQLRRPEMAKHLWTEHLLVLDGRRVREPWKQIEIWINEYRNDLHPEIPARCRALARTVDPEQGLERLYRMLLAGGVDDTEARRHLLTQARQLHATLCPHCFDRVPVPDEIVPRPLNQSRGRLSWDGYCVDVSEHGLIPRLTLETPATVVYRGRQPGRSLTWKGTTLFLAFPPALLGLALAIVFSFQEAPPEWPVIFLFVAAAIAYGFVRIRRWAQTRVLDRAVDYGWYNLAPLLHGRGFSLEDSTFLAGLALDSIKRGRPQVREDALEEVIHHTENAVAGGSGPLAHLAAFKRLRVADAIASGADPLPLLTHEIGRCFDGELPLAFAQWLLEGWKGGWWTPGNGSRLRVLLCDRAFESGLEVLDLLETGHMAAALGSVLHVEDADGLARLRLLWSLRPTCPWARWGEPATVFELARDPDPSVRLLDRYPDLLLVDRSPPGVLICGRGVVFEGITFTQEPRSVETRVLRDFRRDHELVIDQHRFHFPSDPASLARRLERWFRYYFADFRPRVAGVYSWQPPAGPRPLYFQAPVLCPSCQRRVIARMGEVGIAADRLQSLEPIAGEYDPQIQSADQASKPRSL